MNETAIRSRIRAIVNDSSLNDRQRQLALAAAAESLLDPPPLANEALRAMADGIICDLNEGNAPYRPRYLLPDYGLALKQGSSYLELAPPTTLDEALAFLLVLYMHVPSITGYPVFLGDIDAMLEPYTSGLSDGELSDKLRVFWREIDRLLPDAFVHANIGPHSTRVGMVLLRLERELRQVVPNLTMKCDPSLTPSAMLLEGIETVFAVGKPHFVNHPMIVNDLGEDYGVVSCYNTLKIGGGSHTLIRLNLKHAAEHFNGSIDAFLADGALDRYVNLTLDVMESRIKYLVEQAGFFTHHFLCREGLVDLSRFTAMFGLFGMAEAVNMWLARSGVGHERYGRSSLGAEYALRILEGITSALQRRALPYCGLNNGHVLLHAQSGIDSDLGTTAGVRIPIGEELDLVDHILHQAPMHRYFPTGVSDIFHFDKTALSNPNGVETIIRGALRQGMRDFTFNIADNEFVRITGFIARRGDMASVRTAGARNNSAVLGQGSCENSDILQGRKARVLTSERPHWFR